MSKRNSSTIILTEDGKTAGILKGDCLVKAVKPAHFLRRPPAQAIDAYALDQAELLGARRVRFVCIADGRTYEASLTRFRQRGFRLDRGAGVQIALALADFRADPPPEVQLPLWEGRAR